MSDDPDWDELVERHCPTIRRFFASTAPIERVDDLTQETFARLQRARSQGAAIVSFVAYALGIARNVLRELIRQQKRDPRLELSDVSAIDLDPRPSTLLAKRAEHVLLLDALRLLTLEHQIVLMFFYWENLTAREIAEALQENENTVRGRVTRAREKLAERVAELDARGAAARGDAADFDAWIAEVRDAASPPSVRTDERERADE